LVAAPLTLTALGAFLLVALGTRGLLLTTLTTGAFPVAALPTLPTFGTALLALLVSLLSASTSVTL
jgi:hypothetical protein